MYSDLLEELSKAIGARLLISFSYNGESHVVEPHLLGHNSERKDCLCAWCISKDEQEEQGWQYYFLSQMQHTTLLDTRFSRKRPGYDPYNSSMSRIYYRI